MISRERMLAAMSCEATDYVPCSFMIFSALRSRSNDDLDFVERELELGLDAVVELATWGTGSGPDNADLPGPPLEFHPETRVTDWVEESGSGRVIRRRYDTPAGPLEAALRWTDDWRVGPRVPLFDDWVIPRARKHLVQTDEDLDRLPYILAPVSTKARAQLHETATPKKAFAQERGLLVSGGLGVGLEAASWLCGSEQVVWAAVDRPEWLDRLVAILHGWNLNRMEAVLESGVDMFVRRAWYEGTDFLSPAHFRRFVLPSLKAEVELTHQAGAKFAYINTSGTMPILDALIEAGVDVLVGVDPVQGRGTDMAEMRAKSRGRICLWGGVNGFIGVERGSSEEVQEAVTAAVRTLGPDGFILSPVDNVVDTSARTWSNVQGFLQAWKEIR